ncbi:hypothetical protein HPP92_009484 [Vanilla planifolia]|uniref:X8 domain-containing protein n=1 Tax=Vanilla planifolia TaxID=51239 RepID=A0A835R4M1_VANPL|nr:hypothetical protein HPP92_009484 [Vanilla planifolia]
MAAMVFLLLLLALSGCSDAAWCICRTDVSSTALQKTLDYACGAGADCSTILQNGACYNPNTVINHCSYAANSYYQRKGQAPGTCDFSGTAVLTQNDPSLNGCTYPATPSAAATSGGGAGIPAQNPGSSSTATPTGFTPTQGSAGGVLGGLGPSGTTTSIDGNGARRLPSPNTGLLSLTAFLSGLALFRL